MRLQELCPDHQVEFPIPQLSSCIGCTISALLEQHVAVKEFAREIIMEYCWDLPHPDHGVKSDPDGGTIQDLAIKFGLIAPHIATAEDVDKEFDDYGIGDTIVKFTPALQVDKEK